MVTPALEQEGQSIGWPFYICYNEVGDNHQVSSPATSVAGSERAGRGWPFPFGT